MRLGTRRRIVLGTLALAIVLAVAGAGMAILIRPSTDPQDVVKAMYRAIDSGHCDDAAAYWRWTQDRERSRFLRQCSAESSHTHDVQVIRVEHFPEFQGITQAAVYFHLVTDGQPDSRKEPGYLVLQRFGSDWKLLSRMAG